MYQFPSTIFLKNVMAKIMTTTKRHPKEQHLHIYTYMRHIAFTVTLQWIIHYRNYLWRTLLLHWTLAWYKRCILAVWVRLFFICFLFNCFVLFLNLINLRTPKLNFTNPTNSHRYSWQIPSILPAPADTLDQSNLNPQKVWPTAPNPTETLGNPIHSWPIPPTLTESLTNLIMLLLKLWAIPSKDQFDLILHAETFNNLPAPAEGLTNPDHFCKKFDQSCPHPQTLNQSHCSHRKFDKSHPLPQ